VEDQVYTAKETQKILKISRATFEVWKKKGLLKVVKIGGKVLVKKEEIERILNEN
jgi:excisionase family DNA binding protein